jgi:hypothetical protein
MSVFIPFKGVQALPLLCFFVNDSHSPIAFCA